ncbi:MULTISPECIES: DUF4113 domain-containing protein [Bacteria]|uniref:DUF4113 domain-containing protein n=1 Tax=Paracoccus TaxID=265 RepID=UPI0009D76C2B|nr:DUF4113 domain-containing protein [Paracoccus sp. NBH48]
MGSATKGKLNAQRFNSAADLEGVSEFWETKAGHRSSRYTTRISELPTIFI